MTIRLLTVATLATSLLAGTAGLPTAADAGEHSWSRTGPRGATAERTVSRSPGSFERSTSVTGPRGRTASGSTDRSWDQEAGVYSSDRSVTTRTGQAASRSTSAVRNDDGSYSVTGEATGRFGRTRSFEGTYIPPSRP